MQSCIAGVRRVLGSSLVGSALVALLAAPAAAQFTLFNWSLQDDSGDSVTSLAADKMSVIAQWPTLGGGAITAFKAVAPVTCRITLDMHYIPFDGACGKSVPVFVLNHTTTVLASCFASQQLVLTVPAGAEFGLGLQTFDGSWPGWVDFTNFEFAAVPLFEPWTNLGNALPGAGGAPALIGTSLLHGGYPFALDMTGAPVGAPAAVVVGFSHLGVPFKGGVLVPSVDLLVTGLVTDAHGAVHLATQWPAGILSGFTFYLQEWVVDPTGPQGLIATNGLRAETP